MTEETETTLAESEYLGYQLLKHLYEVDNRPVSRSKFLKLSCIADRLLLDGQDVDIGFPRYWYKYGELAAVHDFSRDFINAPSARFWSGQEIHPDREIPDHEFDVEPSVREAITKAVRQTVDRFGKSSVEEIKGHQYRRQAPNNFIEAYSRLRAQFESVDLNEQELLVEHTDGGTMAYFEGLLDEMLDTFPRKRYESVEDLYLRWDDTMRLMLENEADFRDLQDFLDLFIERLSEIVLRFEHNSNISVSRLAEWEEAREGARDDLEEEIRETRREYLLASESAGELSAVAEEYDDLVSNSL